MRVVSSQYRTGGQYNYSYHSIAQMDQLLDEGVKISDAAGLYDFRTYTWVAGTQ